MRKKVFILFLTLSLALSFMPLVAFADTEADGFAAVNETVEAEEAESEEALEDILEAEAAEETSDPVDEATASEDAAEADSKQIVNIKALHAADDEEECSHENTTTEFEPFWEEIEEDDITEIEGDDRYHLVTGPGEMVTYCDDCEEELDRIGVVKGEGKFEHNYEDRKCMDCGHANNCTHENKYTEDELEPNWESAEYAEIEENNRYHTVVVPLEEVTFCEDCGETWREEVDKTEEQEEHKYEHNNNQSECILCHHKNTCTHEHTDMKYSWDPDEVDCDKVNNTVHRVKGPGVLETCCDYCNDVIESKIVTIDEEFYHDYDSDGYCESCDYYNTCKHPSTYKEYLYDTYKCSIEDAGDGKNHTVEGEITECKICIECEQILEKKELGNEKVTEIHYYNKDDICRYCGYQKPDIRVFGNLRYDTAIEVAERCKDSSGKFKNVIVANGLMFPDALSGGYLAKVTNAPILLVEPSIGVESKIVNYISENITSDGTVYILGGIGVVSQKFEDALVKNGLNSKRLGGEDRYETNLKILREAKVASEDIMVCSGTGFADSMSAAAVGNPILLVGKTLTDNQIAYIKGLSSKQYYLIGGTGAVDSAIEEGLKGLKELNLHIERLGGATRYETSTKVAKRFFEKATTVVLAYAWNFPDGLSAGPLAMLRSAPIVLTDKNNTTAAREYVKSAGVVKSITLGGPTLISDIAVNVIMNR